MITKEKTTEVREMTVYALACFAECGGVSGPDTSESAGARFLDRVRDALLEGMEHRENCQDTSAHDDFVWEIADGAVPIYTHERWLAFVDLAAYQEDISDLCADTSDLTVAAGVALYMIAERLCHALIAEMGTS